MNEDLVIKSYREQIKESMLKADAIEKAGFMVILDVLNRRGVNIKEISELFQQLKKSSTKEDLDNVTVDELNSIIEDVNMQITKALISPVDVAEELVRKSKTLAKEKAGNMKVTDQDSYIRVGSNLSVEVRKHGIASGLNVCVKNFCIQKLYQATYREKIKEKEAELGILSEEKSSNEKIEKSVLDKKVNSKKSQTMKEIFGREIGNTEKSFIEVKDLYLKKLNERITSLNQYK